LSNFHAILSISRQLQDFEELREIAASPEFQERNRFPISGKSASLRETTKARLRASRRASIDDRSVGRRTGRSVRARGHVGPPRPRSGPPPLPLRSDRLPAAPGPAARQDDPLHRPRRVREVSNRLPTSIASRSSVARSPSAPATSMMSAGPTPIPRLGEPGVRE